MVLLVAARSVSSTSHTLTVWIRLAVKFSTNFQQRKTSSFMAQKLPMPLLKPHHQNKASSFVQTKHFLSGGHLKLDYQYHTAMSFHSKQPCKDTQNHPDSGSDTSIGFFESWASHQPHTSPVSTLDLSMVSEFFSCVKWTTLQ